MMTFKRYSPEYDKEGFRIYGLTHEDIVENVRRNGGFNRRRDGAWDYEEALQFVERLDGGLDDLHYELERYDELNGTLYHKGVDLANMCNLYLECINDELRHGEKRVRRIEK